MILFHIPIKEVFNIYLSPSSNYGKRIKYKVHKGKIRRQPEVLLPGVMTHPQSTAQSVPAATGQPASCTSGVHVNRSVPYPDGQQSDLGALLAEKLPKGLGPKGQVLFGVHFL